MLHLRYNTETMQKLEEIRSKIDVIDEKMAELFAERMKLVREVAEYKRANGLPIEDKAREEEILKRGAAVFEKVIASEAAKPSREDYLRFQKAVIQISRDSQK